MSYDLMVFEPDAVPASHAEFLDWYAGQTKWGEDHGYDDPALSSASLRAWFADMIEIFPPMHGRFARERGAEDGASSSDYAIGADFIYVSFAWSEEEAAYMTMARLAEKHHLGLFNASSSGEEVWLPMDGRMTLAHDKSPPTLVGRIKDLLNMSK
jgi:hypothetical protein